MPRFTLSFDTDTAAFDYDRTVEVARILRQTADAVLSGGSTAVRDLNGNTVGEWDLPAVEEEPTPGS